MGEELVLANLSVDAEGVVQGISEGNRAFDQGEAGLVKYGQANMVAQESGGSLLGTLLRLSSVVWLVVKVMSLLGVSSTAAATGMGILGITLTGVTIAGVLAFAAAIAAVLAVLAAVAAVIGTVVALLGTLVGQIIVNTDAWKTMTGAIEDWYLWLIKGENTLERVSRKMKDFGAAATLTQLEELAALTKQREEMQDQISLIRTELGQGLIEVTTLTESMIAKMPPWLQTMVRIFRPEDMTLPAVMAALEADLIINRERSDELFRSLQKVIAAKDIAAATGAAFPGAAGPTPPTRRAGGEAASVLGLTGPLEFASQAQAAGEEMRGLHAELRAGVINIKQFEAAIDTFAEKLQFLGMTFEEAQQFAASFGVQLEGVTDIPLDPTPWENYLASLDAATEKSQIKVTLLSSAMSAFASSLSTQLTNGGFSFKMLMADLLKAMVPVFIALGSQAAVRAYLGEPHLWAVAQFAFAAAGAAAVAAAALGGGGAGAAEPGLGPGRRAEAALETGGSRGPGASITIVVQGSLIGTNPDDLARDLGRLIETNQGDGSR
jgi:hypothetical protein